MTAAFAINSVMISVSIIPLKNMRLTFGLIVELLWLLGELILSWSLLSIKVNT